MSGGTNKRRVIQKAVFNEHDDIWFALDGRPRLNTRIDQFHELIEYGHLYDASFVCAARHFIEIDITPGQAGLAPHTLRSLLDVIIELFDQSISSQKKTTSKSSISTAGAPRSLRTRRKRRPA